MFMQSYVVTSEWINECLMTPQHEKQIGYWVSEKEKECMTWEWCQYVSYIVIQLLGIY